MGIFELRKKLSVYTITCKNNTKVRVSRGFKVTGKTKYNTP